MLHLATNPISFQGRLLGEHEPVVTVGVGPIKVTYLLGLEANRFAFANPNLFSWAGAYQSLVAVSGESALLLSDGPDHRRRRAVVAPSFTPGSVRAHRELIVENTHRVIDTWQPGQHLDLYAAFKPAIRSSIIAALFGDRLAAQESIIGTCLQPSLNLAGDDPWRAAARRNLRSPAWRRAVTGRELVARLVRKEIGERAARGDGDDLLTALISSEHNSQLSRTEVVDQTISLMAAGYETTSAAFAWVCQQWLSEPCRESASEHIVAETLRLHPPAVVIGRVAAQSFQYAGAGIPKGRLVLLSPYVTHRSSSGWPNPLCFDTSRWDSQTSGSIRPGRDKYLPFGAGLHHCIGAHLANAQLVTMLNTLRERTQLRLVGPPTQKVANLAALRPRGGVRVVVERSMPRIEANRLV